MLQAAQVRREVEDEFRVLLSLLRIPADSEAPASKRLAESIRFWNEHARVPELLDRVYVAADATAEQGMVYERGFDGFRSQMLPADVVARLRSGDAGNDRRRGVPRIEAAPETEQILIVWIQRPAGGSEEPSASAVAVRIDSSALFDSLLPKLMKRHLDGFPYRVVSADGTTLSREAGDVAAEREPEVSLPLGALWGSAVNVQLSSGTVRRTSDIPPVEPDVPETLNSPVFRFWLYRGRADAESGVLTERYLQPGGDEPILEVYYPNASLASVMTVRRVTSIAASAGILAVLIVSAAILYRLYRRSSVLRAQEQEFVASMSHELRTPITVIQSLSENLSRNVVTNPERLPRYAKAIREQIGRLSGMVEGILAYAGLQSGGGLRPAITEVDPALLVTEVAGALGPMAAEHGGELWVQTEGLPQQVRTDPKAVRMIIENLLVNAIRHATPGPIRLRVTRKLFDSLQIVVEDQGPGIPPGEQNMVFEAFSRAAQAAREQRPGSGLGLHLVKRLTFLLGGSVDLESPYTNIAQAPQKGCRFTVTVPVEAAEDV
jgi:signal transduction histidine kinase